MREPAYQLRYSRLKDTLDVLLSEEMLSESRFLGATVVALGGAYLIYDLILQYVVHL